MKNNDLRKKDRKSRLPYQQRNLVNFYLNKNNHLGMVKTEVGNTFEGVKNGYAEQ